MCGDVEKKKLSPPESLYGNLGQEQGTKSRFNIGQSDCDTFIYKIFGLHIQLLAHSSPNSWNFLNVESEQGVIVILTEMTFGSHPRVGADGQETQPCDWRFGTFREGRGAGGLINCQWPIT